MSAGRRCSIRVQALALTATLSAATARAQTPPIAPTPPTTLTLAEAEQTALRTHPLIQAAEYTAQASRQTVREARAAYFPAAFGSVTGAAALDGSRIAAGGLNNPVIYDRFATGVSVGQLIADFGRTRALVESSTSTAQAQEQTVQTERATVLLDVDRAYFGALRAQAVQRVAQATVAARQLAFDQVNALAQGNLRSGLDVSFARVNLSSAQLLLIQAQNDTDRAFAALAAAIGAPTIGAPALTDEPVPSAPAADSAALLAEALRQRPELIAARFAAEAALRLADAEADLIRPSLTAVGAAGVTPYHQTGINDRYAAVGVNMNVPIANGNLFAARHAEALLRARAQQQRVRDLENQIGRDVRVAWLNARTAYERLGLTQQLLEQATQALDLAQQRYNLGLGSIVELNQAQLNQTQADLDAASARYDYQVQVAAVAFATGSRR